MLKNSVWLHFKGTTFIQIFFKIATADFCLFGLYFISMLLYYFRSYALSTYSHEQIQLIKLYSGNPTNLKPGEVLTIFCNFEEK